MDLCAFGLFEGFLLTPPEATRDVVMSIVCIISHVPTCVINMAYYQFYDSMDFALVDGIIALIACLLVLYTAWNSLNTSYGTRHSPRQTAIVTFLMILASVFSSGFALESVHTGYASLRAQGKLQQWVSRTKALTWIQKHAQRRTRTCLALSWHAVLYDQYFDRRTHVDYRYVAEQQPVGRPKGQAVILPRKVCQWHILRFR